MSETAEIAPEASAPGQQVDTVLVTRSGGGLSVEESPSVLADCITFDFTTSYEGKSWSHLLSPADLGIFASLDVNALRASQHCGIEVDGTDAAYAYHLLVTLRDTTEIRLSYLERPGVPLASLEPQFSDLLEWAQRETSLFDGKVFSRNLTRLIRAHGMSMAAAAQLVDVSRQAMSYWKLCKSAPSDDKINRLCTVFACTRAMLFSDMPDEQRLLTPAEWARREGITKHRAIDLVRYGLVTGAVPTSYGYMFPSRLKAPPESAELLRIAKRRPWWVDNFQRNFPRLIKDRSKSEIARSLRINPSAVGHWTSGTGYPREDRLEEIAAVLGVTIEQLTSQSPRAAPEASREV